MFGPWLSLDQSLECVKRAFPTGRDHFVITAPACALLESALTHVYVRRRTVSRARHFERHRTDGISVGRQEVHVGDKKPVAGLILHDRAAEDAAKPSERFIAELRG